MTYKRLVFEIEMHIFVVFSIIFVKRSLLRLLGIVKKPHARGYHRRFVIHINYMSVSI